MVITLPVSSKMSSLLSCIVTSFGLHLLMNGHLVHLYPSATFGSPRSLFSKRADLNIETLIRISSFNKSRNGDPFSKITVQVSRSDNLLFPSVLIMLGEKK